MPTYFFFTRWTKIFMMSLFLIPTLGATSESLKVKKEKMITPSTIEILTAKEVFKKLNEAADQVRIIDARDSNFQQGHIPGSQSMNWQEWSEEKPGIANAVFGHPEKWGRILRGPEVQQKLRTLGLSQNKIIVVVGDPKGWGEEGRVAWNLLYWGATHVALLDGGFPAWKTAGFPIEVGKAKTSSFGNFAYAVSNQRQATKASVEENLKSRSRLLLDARSADEFEGTKMPGQKRGGHIPGSILIEFQKLYQSDGLYISAEALKKQIGQELTSAPITYCTGGVRSALLALLIEARLGISVLNYEASIWEWSADLKLPLIMGKH